MKGRYSLITVILALLASTLSPMYAREQIPSSNPFMGTPLSHYILNPTYLADEGERSMPNFGSVYDKILIEGGIDIGYFGIEELNPYYLTSAFTREKYGFALSVEGINTDIVTDMAFSGAAAYQLIEDLTLGASYSLLMFQAQGYERLINHDIGVSMKANIADGTSAYLIVDDILNEKRRLSSRESVNGRHFFLGIAHSEINYAYGGDLQLLDERLSINPFFRYIPSDEFEFYLKAQSANMAAAGGLLINVLDGYIGIETIYTELGGFDFSLAIGYEFRG